MNRLLAALKKSEDFSVDTLRSLYRRLAVQCHPDASKGSAAEFVRLQTEYDEALRFVLSDERRVAVKRPRPTNPREAFLRALYLFSIMHGSRNWRARISPLIKLAFAYDSEIGALFVDYRDVFLRKLDGPDYMTFLLHLHEMLLASIKTLAWFYETGNEWDRRMLKSYLDELSQRAGRLKGGLAVVVRGLCQFIRREARNPALPILTVGTAKAGQGRR